MKLAPDLVGRVRAAALLIPHHQRTPGDNPGRTGQSDPLPDAAHTEQAMRWSSKLPW